MRKELSQAAKMLLDGADWLENHDWLQFAVWSDDKQSACALGAIFSATPGKPLPSELVPELCDFNNAPGRTKEQVIAHMRELAALY